MNEVKTHGIRQSIDILIDTDITGLKFYGLVEEIRTGLCKKIDLLRIEDVMKNLVDKTRILNPEILSKELELKLVTLDEDVFIKQKATYNSK